MNITDKAVEAAARAAYDDAFMAHAPDYLPRYDEEDEVVKDSWREVARVSLEAAAPFIAAQALRDLASDFPEWAEISNTFHVEDCVAEFNRRADELDPQ